MLVQAVFFLMLGKLELLEFHWLGITEVGHFTTAMWIKLFHTKLSGFWGFSQKLAVSAISNSQTAQQLFIRAAVLQGRWEYQSHSIHTQKKPTIKPQTKLKSWQQHSTELIWHQLFPRNVSSKQQDNVLRFWQSADQIEESRNTTGMCNLTWLDKAL